MTPFKEQRAVKFSIPQTITLFTLYFLKFKAAHYRRVAILQIHYHQAW